MYMNRLTKMIRLSFSSLIIVLSFSLVFYMYDHTHFDGFTKLEDEKDKFLNRIYFTVTTFSSTGYGDVSPATRPVKIISMILQFMLIITVVGSIIE